MSENKSVPNEMYSAFMNLWNHQDQLKWSRITWGITIEAGLLTGSFAKPGIPASIFLVLGTFVLFLLWGMFLKDFKDQKETLKIIDAFHKENGFEYPKARLLAETEDKTFSATKQMAVVASLVVFFNICLFILNILKPFDKASFLTQYFFI